MKKIFSFLLAAVLLLALTPAAFAVNQSRAVIGADLNQEQVAAVYQAFGVSRGSVIELSVTNAEERQWL